jgi:hypothetical protein
LKEIVYIYIYVTQGCGSGSGAGLDPDSVTLWIRIHGQENEEISVEKCTFKLFFLNLPVKRFEQNFDEQHRYFLFD